jgi:peroxiredoxin
MTWTTRCIGLLLAALITMLAAGCTKKADEDLTKGAKGTADWSAFKSDKKTPTPSADKKIVSAPPAKEEVPKTDLTVADALPCLVKVGDAMPDAQLLSLDGKEVPLSSLVGDKAAVVLFWSSASPYSRQALKQLGEDVIEPFGAKGVRVITIAVKEPPEVARKTIEDVGAKSANLVDADGAFFAKVATEKLPRVYLLDPSRKILWFDIEWSRNTRTLLRQGLRATVGPANP